jgi:hypothetical protein
MYCQQIFLNKTVFLFVSDQHNELIQCLEGFHFQLIGYRVRREQSLRSSLQKGKKKYLVKGSEIGICYLRAN